MFERHPGHPRPQGNQEIVAASGGDLDALLAALADPDGARRQRAREEIVDLGATAVPGLIDRLEHGAFRLRWEAAKALGAIGDPAATPSLLAALRDRNPDVRWLAAEALAAIGGPGATAVLATLIDHCGSGWVRQGVHHVLHGYGDPQLRHETAALVAVLGRTADDADVVRAAEEALRGLRAGRVARDRSEPRTPTQGE